MVPARRRRTAAAAAAGAVALGLLAACGSDDGTPVLTWYINPDDGGQVAIAASCTDEAQGRYVVETSLLPRDAAGQREQLARRLAAGDTSIDLMSLDPPFVAEFAEAGFLAEIPPDVAAAAVDDVVAGAVEGATWRDELVAVPFWANTQLLWYRTSVAEAAGLDMSQPVTWDDLVEAAESQDSTIGAQGALAESLTVWITAVLAGAGGEVLTNPEAPADEVQLGLETEAGREAARIVGEVARSSAAGPGFSTRDENASMLLFRGASGGFMVNYPFVWPATEAAVEDGSVDQSVLDDFGWAIYPASVEGQDAAPPLGGIDLGVSEFSEHRDLAFEATQCITSEENQKEYFLTNGNPAAKASVFDDPEVQQAFPMAEELRTSLEQAVPRPQTAYYNEVSVGLQRTWHPPAGVGPDTSLEQATELIAGVLRGDRLL